MSEIKSAKPKLRIVTYMCPTHPVQLYDLIMEVLETALGCHATLQYESRGSGPLTDRPDPFINNEVDLAFMTALSYIKLKEDKNDNAQLLPITPVFTHPKNVYNKPGYFADIIIHTDKKTHNVSSILDLRGSTYVYSNEDSLSGSKIVLNTLFEKGENASFFGSLLKSGSHLASAQMVLTKQAEWASVDSTTLLYSKKYMQDGGKDITVLESLGPLYPYPIVVNKALPADTKRKITDALLNLPHTNEWRKRFAKYGVVKYVGNSPDAYESRNSKLGNVKAQSLNIRYY